MREPFANAQDVTKTARHCHVMHAPVMHASEDVKTWDSNLVNCGQGIDAKGLLSKGSNSPVSREKNTRSTHGDTFEMALPIATPTGKMIAKGTSRMRVALHAHDCALHKSGVLSPRNCWQ